MPKVGGAARSRARLCSVNYFKTIKNTEKIPPNPPLGKGEI